MSKVVVRLIWALFLVAAGSGELLAQEKFAISGGADINLRFNGHEPPPALVKWLKLEVAAIWEPYGVMLRWRSSWGLAPSAPAQVSFDVLVDQRDHSTSRGAILGNTTLMVRPDQPVLVRIDRDAAEALLGSVSFGLLARLTGHTSIGPANVGIALGRILAHEIGHVLLATREHQPHGLMRAAFAAEDLLRASRDAFRLSSTELLQLRQREADAHGG